MINIDTIRNKKLLIFDKDDTLTNTKSPIEVDTAIALAKTFTEDVVAIISGSTWQVLQEQVVGRLPGNTDLSKLYILPASGSQLLSYDKGKWTSAYDESISISEYERIKPILIEAYDKLPKSLKPQEVFSDQVEYRVGQITISLLGQTAPRELKKAWDPDRSKRRIMVNYLKLLLEDYDIKIGGSTSIDITRHGVNKEFGVRKLLDYLHLKPQDAIYFGDSLGPGGNDEIVKNIHGLDVVAVQDHHELYDIIARI